MYCDSLETLFKTRAFLGDDSSVVMIGDISGRIGIDFEGVVVCVVSFWLAKDELRIVGVKYARTLSSLLLGGFLGFLGSRLTSWGRIVSIG